MCEVTPVHDECGNYSDIPPDWGNEVLAADEVIVLVIGILLDVAVAAFFILIVAFNYSTEFQRWLSSRTSVKLPPYEKVSDYLRGNDDDREKKLSKNRRSISKIPSVELAGDEGEWMDQRRSTGMVAGGLSPQETSQKSSVRTFSSRHLSQIPGASISQTRRRTGHDRRRTMASIYSDRIFGGEEDNMEHGPQLTDSDREHGKSTVHPLQPGLPSTERKRFPRRTRLRFKHHPSSSVFLPISKAKPKERLQPSSESDRSASPTSGIRMRRIRRKAIVRPPPKSIPRWDSAPKK